MMRERRGVLRLPVNGEEISVPGMTYLGCPECREVVLRYDEAGQLEEGALQIYRKRHGLLSAADVRSIRRRFGLKRADLARLLCLGADTISRWEAGRGVQTATQDVLLRLLRDVPGSIEYLRRRAA